MNKAKILSLDITLGKYDLVLDQIIALARNNTPSYVCFANVHMTMEAAFSKEVQKAISGANIITADGVPLAKSIGYKYGLKQDRIAGMDAMPDILAKAANDKLSVFFLGTSNEVLQSIQLKIKSEHPSLRIAGMISPPFSEDLETLSKGYVDTINESQTNIVMVALGCPKQEKWMANNSSKINAVLLGLGGAFPVYADLETRAPKWMQKLSLEWLYRLIQDPARLFKRYFITNSLFLLRMTMEVISFRLKNKSQKVD